MPGASEQVVAQLSINGKGLEFEKCITQTAYFLLDDNQQKMTGKFVPLKHRVESSIELHRIAIDLQPTPEEMDELLPFLGYSESADIWTPDFVVDPFVLKADAVAKVFTYPECYMALFEFTGKKGGFGDLHLEIFARSLTVPAGAPGSYADAKVAATAAYAFTRGTYLHGVSNFLFDQHKLVHNLNLAARFNNNPTFDSAQTTGFEYFLGVSTPYTSDEIGILDTNIATRDAQVTGVDDITLKYLRGTQQLKFVFDNGTWESQVPPLTGVKDEVRLPQWWKMYLDDAADIVTITNVIT